VAAEDDGVAHQGRRGRKVCADDVKLNGLTAKMKPSSGRLLEPVHAVPSLNGCWLSNWSPKYAFVPPEVDGLASRIDLGLVHSLRLARASWRR